MKKISLIVFALVYSINVEAQFFKNIYEDFLKYGTIYAAGNIGNSYQTQRPKFFVRTDPNDLYAVPEVIDVTEYFPNDYRIGFGIRRLARFDYEVKGANFYNGTENNVALSAPTAAIKGFEYLLHYEKERQRGETWINKRFFIRHTGKYHIIKFENRSEGNVDFNYSSAEARLRLPIGKKLSLSAGIIFRTHEKAYGYNPIEIWLNQTDDEGRALNPWFTLGYTYGYTDEAVYHENVQTGESVLHWRWRDPQGNIVAYTDEQFRDQVFYELMNRFNQEQWDLLDNFAEIAPIIGFDYYHYKNNFWLHAYGNWILPHHRYIKGNENFSYLHRNGWGVNGHSMMHAKGDGDQWSDYQAGIMFGWKLGKSFGVFAEGEYTKFWDSEIYQSNFGINITFN